MKNAIFGTVGTLIIAILCFISSVRAQNNRYGLEYVSFETAQEKRTSLNLTPEKPFSFPDGFVLAFDMSYQLALPDYNFGYIFRIIGERERHIDLVMSLTKFTVVNYEGKVLSECTLSDISADAGEFFSFSLLLDLRANSMKITIDSLEFTPAVSDLQYFRKSQIVFGRCDAAGLQSSDVPKVIIKDVSLQTVEGTPLFQWTLAKHTDSGVYDELHKHFAVVDNPCWLLDAHAFWQKRVSFQTMNNPQITYNTKLQHIIIADKKTLYAYDACSHSLIKNEPAGGTVYSDNVNQMVYNKHDNRYYSYCLDIPNGKKIAVFDTINNCWTNTSTDHSNADFWHHNKLVSDIDSCLYIFAGYGYHKYKNIINKYSFAAGTWEETAFKGDVPHPRYLCGLGLMNEHTALLFGGYGSETGMQELSPHNFYDLYEIDLQTLRSNKLWELKPQTDNFVVANSMIVDTLNRCFYALCFPQQQFNTYLFLARFHIDKPEYEIVSDRLPFQFRDILSYADLFLNPVTNELSAITFTSVPADSSAVVNIWSLSYPPVSERSIKQEVSKGGAGRILIAIAACLICALVAGYVLFKRRRRKNLSGEGLAEPQNDALTPAEAVARDRTPSIRLFGGFRVTAGDGSDVTGEFSPILKQLLLLIMLKTFEENGKGVSSIKLKDTLWFDKSVESARNNRGVMLNRIRQIFERVGNITIEGQNSYWSIRLGDGVYCDYREAITLINSLKHQAERSKADVMRLVNIVSVGSLLPNTQVEWLDAFKADFANSLIDLLLDAAEKLKLSHKELIELADAISVHDILNEEALKMKCSALVKMGKHGLAKTAYTNFANEYLTLFQTKYAIPIERFLQ